MYVYSCNNDGPLTIDEANIHDNVTRGVYLYNCNRPINLLRSTIDGNTGAGFFANYGDPAVIRANTFSNQTGAGLVLSYPSEIILSKNTFTGNGTNASISDSSGETRLVFNEFGSWTDADNEGLEFAGGSAATYRSVHFNNFREYAPASFDVQLRNAVSSSVNGRVNYWDPDTYRRDAGRSVPPEHHQHRRRGGRPVLGPGRLPGVPRRRGGYLPAQVCGFTNPVDGDVLTGMTFNMQGAAAADAGIQLVEFSTDGGDLVPGDGRRAVVRTSGRRAPRDSTTCTAGSPTTTAASRRRRPRSTWRSSPPTSQLPAP